MTKEAKHMTQTAPPRTARNGILATLALAIFMAVLGMAPATAAVPPEFWTSCQTGSAAGQCSIPRGIAVSELAGESRGHLYIADQENSRINELTAWGNFVKTWGWDVVASGPGDDTTAPEDQFEVCVPANGDVCKAGVVGSGTGQFNGLQGMAVDSAGDIYVVDRNNHRVQKFSPAGEFLLTFGGDVNKTKVEEGAPQAERNRCPVAPGEVCQAGTGGSGNGQFGSWQVGNFIAVDPGPTPSEDTIYVGDEGRIQKLDPTGTYQGEIALPGETVQSLALDPAGNLYVSFFDKSNNDKPNVRKLTPAGTAGVPATFTVPNPRGVAVDADGMVYVFDKAGSEVLQFSPGAVLEGSFAEDLSLGSTGIGTAAACGNGTSVYLSNSILSNSFVRAYGAQPNPLLCPPLKAPPSINSQFARSVSSDSAVLGAEINPHYWSGELGTTTYYVQYGTEACLQGGWEAACVEAQPLPPGATLQGGVVDEDVSAGAVLTDLLPETAYRYRFVAEGSGAPGEPIVGLGGKSGQPGADAGFATFPLPVIPKTNCPNQAFRSGASAHLSDCRAYEMVSPLDKNNGDITTLTRLTHPTYPSSLEQSTPDGEKITYSSATAFGDAQSAPWSTQYLATRHAGAAWSTHAISAPRETQGFSTGILKYDLEYKAFSEDLCSGWFVRNSDPPLSANGVAGFPGLYQRQNCGAGEGAYDAITTVVPPSVSPSNYLPELQGLSVDGVHAFFRANDKLTIAAPEISGPQLYELSAGEASPRYICVLPDASPSGAPCSAGTVNGGFDGRESTVAGAVSEDGSRVYWSTGVVGEGKLYLRVHPEREQSAMVGEECSEAEKACTVSLSTGSARFWTASSDGGVAVFSEGEQLFAFDANKALAYEVGAAQPIASGLIGLAGASEDAQRLYFVSEDQLEGEGTAGKPNLYLYDAAGATTTFIAMLSGNDVASGGESGLGPPLQVASGDPMRRALRVSPDGTHIAFTSAASLTGYDNTDATSEEADAEVFLYDSESDELACISCNPTGSRPRGRNFEVGGVQRGFWVAAQIPTWENQLYAPHVLSDDGSRLFFESFEALVPQDTNAKQDVYEWERAPGEAKCKELGAELYVASAAGCLSLISSGESPTDSELADVSANGRDVFFRTLSSLLPQDPGLIDLYDAREEGGLPAPPEPGLPCEGDACQSPPPAPNDPTPASASFKAPPLPPKAKKPRSSCPKGKHRARRGGKGRCVRHAQRKQNRHNNHRRAAR